MAGQTTGNSAQLIRSELWSKELKMALEDELMMAGYVDIIVDFPDGDQFTVPSVGEFQVDDYVEDTAVVYRPLDTGEWTFTIDEYLATATYITKKNEQDMFYMSQLVSSFVPKQLRAIMKHYETNVLEKPEDVLGASANSNFTINGAHHRFSGGNGGIIEIADFAAVLHSLKTADVPQENLIAIVDPSVEFQLNVLSNLVSVSNNPKWEGIIADGIGSGMRFVKNVYGFDVFTSNYLPDITASALPDRGGSNNVDYSSTSGKANYFFSASPDVLPWKSAWRQPPTVDSEWDMDNQRTKYLTTARYGTKLYRPENMVIVASTPTIS